MPQERRRQPRLPFAVRVEIRAPGTSISASTRDVCTTGLCVAGAQPLPIGTPCDLEIVLTSGELVQSIRGKGRVVRQVEGLESSGGGLGIQFTEMDPEDQALLWRVIRYNTPVAHGTPLSGKGDAPA